MNWTALGLAAGLALLPSTTDDAEVLLEADRVFCADTTERGLDGWLSSFAADAVVATPAGEFLTGMEALEEYYGSLPFPPPGFRWEPDAGGIAASGELGFTAGSWEIRPPGAADDAEFPRGRYLSVWRRQPDGGFRVVADIGGEVDFRTRLDRSPGPPLDWSATTERFERAEGGRFAFAVGTWSARSRDPATGVEAEHEGGFLTVWERTVEGSWKVASEIGFEIPR